MKKLLFLFLATVALSTGLKANYNDGYDNGYFFGYQIVEIIVDTHPEYGALLEVNSYSDWNQYAGYAGTGLPTYITTPSVSANYQYSFEQSYSAFYAAQVAINHLWATGAYDWLMAQSTVSPWHLGLYDGFMAGTYQRMWDFQTQ